MSIKLEQSFACLLLTFQDWWVSWIPEPDLQEPTFPPGPQFKHNTFIYFPLHSEYPCSKSLSILSATGISSLLMSPIYPARWVGIPGDLCPSLPVSQWWEAHPLGGWHAPCPQDSPPLPFGAWLPTHLLMCLSHSLKGRGV